MHLIDSGSEALTVGQMGKMNLTQDYMNKSIVEFNLCVCFRIY